MTATISLDWETIKESTEYQADITNLTEILVNSLGNDSVFTSDSPLIYAVVSLLATNRYFARHIPDAKDIDTTPFLELIKEEIGVGLPLTDAIPVVEFLREAKNWYGHKGTEALYPFIGDLVGSPIEIHYPGERIFTLDSDDTYLDGTSTPGGVLDWAHTKVGYFQDGHYYANYVYIVEVLQSQNIVNFEDLINFISSIHPAGTKRFLQLDNAYFAEGTHISTEAGSLDEYNSLFYTGQTYISLDNGWNLDDTGSLLDMEGGTSASGSLYIQPARDQAMAIGYRTFMNDGLLRYPSDIHAGKVVLNKDTISLTRSNPDGTYTTYYADTDPDIAFNQQQNNGLFYDGDTPQGNPNFAWGPGGYGVISMKDQAWSHIENIAWANEGNSYPNEWYPYLLNCTIITS